MSAAFEIHQHSPAASASAPRAGSRIALIILHSDPRPAADALSAYTAPAAPSSPHYYIDRASTITQLVPEARAALHSGLAIWAQRYRNIDRISIGITLEHTPGTLYSAAQLAALHWLLGQLYARYSLHASDVRLWASEDPAQETGNGVLIPISLPSVPLPTAPGEAITPILGGEGHDHGASAEEIICVPPPPPPPVDEFSSPVLGGPGANVEAEQRLWVFLQQETYRQRGEGLRSDWAFHLYASRNNLGAPLARSAPGPQQIRVNDKQYGFQVFAGDTVFNEIPKWSEVQSLNNLLRGSIPASGLARQILEASYATGQSALHSQWAFHQQAVREKLGPPLGGSYRITVKGQEYSIQVFAADTLYNLVPHWSDVKRLSETPPGDLYHALWIETCKPGGSAYDPNSPFQQLAAREKLGAPLSGVYQADFEGILYNIQVFAADTLFARPGEAPARQRQLARPATFNVTDTPAEGSVAISDGSNVSTVISGPDDALSNKRPTFSMLPIAGQPRISQFYGYTRWAAQNRFNLYQFTQGRHSGIDFAVPVGTPLLAISHGVVVWAGSNVSGQSFGAGPRSIIVRYGNIYALYGHVSSERVSRGQRVSPGQELGRSGYPQAPHLHFELRPVPDQTLGNREPNQGPRNPGFAANPMEFFSTELSAYFNRWFGLLGGARHFCCGSLHDQPGITFGAAVDQRPCTN